MSDKRQPWLRFYTADWRGDAGLRAVGFAARGLWMDLLSMMHEATPYGHLVVNGAPLDAARIAARLGGTAKEVQALLDRLEAEGVFSRTEDGAIFSRRMVRDADKAARDRENGKGGGNPTLRAKKGSQDNPPDNGGVNPPDKAHAAAARASQMPEARSSEADASGPAGPAEAPPDARTTLFREGLDRLRRLTGLDRGRGAALLGRLLKAAADDCAAVGLVLAEAEALRPADPVPWLIRTVESRARGHAPSGARPGKPIVRSPFEVIAERRARREAEGEFTLQ